MVARSMLVLEAARDIIEVGGGKGILAVYYLDIVPESIFSAWMAIFGSSTIHFWCITRESQD